MTNEEYLNKRIEEIKTRVNNKLKDLVQAIERSGAFSYPVRYRAEEFLEERKELDHWCKVRAELGVFSDEE